MRNDFQVGVINTDHTNREKEKEKDKKTINSPQKLATSIHNLIETELAESFTRLVTLTEFGKTASDLLLEKLNKKSKRKYEKYGDFFPSRDYTAFYWENDIWKSSLRDGKQDIIWSDIGKYSGVILENDDKKKSVLYVSVHLPKNKKEKKKCAIGELQKLVEEAPDKYEIDGVIIAGDFNAQPSEIRSDIFIGRDNYKLGIDDDKKLTTKKSSIDNIVTSDAITPIVKIYDRFDEHKLTHHPLFATLKFDDDEDEE